MNRGLIGFLIFLSVLLVGFGIVAHVLGPNVLAFVFHGDRAEPIVIVNLVDFADAERAQVYARDYETPAVALIAALGGREMWKASADDVVRGQLQDAWSSLDLVTYPSRAAFTELVTSSDYRALLGARDAAVKRAAMLAATPIAPSQTAFDVGSTQTHAVRFLTGSHVDSLETYDAKWLEQDAQILERHGGTLVWRARLSPLTAEREQRFDEMLIYGFADVESRDAWVGDTERETFQTLQRRLFRRDVLVLADSQTMVQPPPAPSDAAAPPADVASQSAADQTTNTSTDDAAPTESDDETRTDAANDFGTPTQPDSSRGP
jgi:uncharacterized protein (DUF1330 family)